MNILVTGGIGYIGSHTIIELLKDSNNQIIVIDNLINSRIEIKDIIEEISMRNIKFYNIDLTDFNGINEVFNNEDIDSVIHFAALKAVGESVEKPLEYYNNNIIGTLNLLIAMKKHNVKKFIFSSSATVYGDSDIMPVYEELPIMTATNPYGRTKTMIEDILRDIYISDRSWDIVLLRYFNPVGAHESGLIGELPNGIPSNLMPYISKVADGELDYVRVFGNDYDTPDGTGVRDYIHVVDLAKGHVSAMKKLKNGSGLNTYNLGTGQGYSVLEIINAFSKASSKKIPYKIVDRRAGDIATSYANPSKAKNELGWCAEKSLEDMCKDFWKWQCIGMKNFK
ncbi:UDP-glucose 4-epimerase GalE [Clostridium sardiniense]|uniref:UDP-glucose 4-epimerase GalE n=1 Tax=Clostridium sardiniense TaxID=29369 RepID=UPI001959B1A5|nr:UDP-glucose 4-epimerase GalE [Clostridium sardiniense]MBM7833069.1 UDP-glucose 4-epimerase [Clostridium sardiniense]